MYKKYLENLITYRDSAYKCYLCHDEIQTKNVDEHIATIQHKQRINQIDKSIRDAMSLKLDTITEKEQKTIIQNQVTIDYRHPFRLFCHICRCSICGLSNALEHIKGSLHRSTFATAIAKDNKEAKISSTFKVNDCITLNTATHMFKCNICNQDISGGMNNVQQHIGSKFHQSIASKLDKKTVNIVMKQSNGTNISALTKMKDDIVDICFCQLCKFYLTNTTILQFHNLVHLYTDLYTSLGNYDIIKINFNQKKEPIVKCLLCNVFIDDDGKGFETSFFNHLKSLTHLKRLQFFKFVKDDIHYDDSNIEQVDMQALDKMKFKPSMYISKTLFCRLCDVPLTSAADKTSHQNGNKHQTNVLLYIEKVKIPKISNQDLIADKSHFYTCYMCEISFFDAANLLNHYKEKIHKLRMYCFNLIIKDQRIIFGEIKDQTVAKCKLHQVKLYTCKCTLDHLLGRKHQSQVDCQASTSASNSSLDNSQSTNNEIITLNTKAMPAKPTTSKLSKLEKRNEFETSAEELLKLGFSVENLSIESNTMDVDDLLNGLNLLDSNARIRKPTSNTEGRKTISSFSQNVYLWGTTFIKNCINSGEESIYNIDPEKMRLLKLGTSSIFPLESGLACLICTEELADEQILFEHLQHTKHLRSLQEMEELHREFQKSEDEFSDLELANNFMQEESVTRVHCYACKSKLWNHDTFIRSHIKNSDHIVQSQSWKKLSNQIFDKFSTIFNEIWYYAEAFFCTICKVKNDMEIDFIMHLNSQKHLNAVKKLQKKGTLTEFGLCPVCITYWYGDSNFYNIHCEEPYHKRFAKNGDFMVPKMTDIALDLLNNVDHQIEFLRNESNKVILDKCKENELLRAIEETVEEIYPKAKAYTFGSRLSHLGFVDSDVDVFLDCNNLYNKRSTKEESQKYLKAVKTNFEMEPNIWIVDEILLYTRVPILKLRHIPTHLKCDISFINGLSVEKSTLVGIYNTAYPICRDLILFLKKWLALCRISGSDGITTFAISWYVIFYLQIQGILPSVYELIRLKNESKIVDGWECGFMDTFSVNHSGLSFREHLKQFFNYYAKFDYKTDVACPYLGKIIKKSTFAYINQLPTEMNIYKTRMQRDYLDIFRFDSPMCIQDPIDLSQNITKAVRKLQLRCFRQYCTESAIKC